MVGSGAVESPSLPHRRSRRCPRRTTRLLPSAPSGYSQPPRERSSPRSSSRIVSRDGGGRTGSPTRSSFEFEPGGRWVFVMHGPSGASYPNENVFREIQPDSRIVIEHVVKPWYRLTVTLAARDDGTHLDWVQEFESPEFAAKMRRISETANEQNLDRLQALLASGVA
ncbi:MAG TPA: SRPBCC domain-containing protein [Longimicrobium sp.]|nr:SRPBCC domain-containing protein [Longimicrobium sp.]